MKLWQRGWATTGLVLAALLAGGVAGCGGGSSSGDGQVRLVNLTRSHAALDLATSSTSSSKLVSSVTPGTASAFKGVGAGSATLLVTDTGSTTTLISTGPSITKDQSYALVVYESNSTLKSAWLSENESTPTSGTGALRVVNLATDAGGLDIYVTTPSTVLTSSLSPTYSLAAGSGVLTTASLSLAPGSWRVRVTAAGTPADLRLDLPAVAVSDQQVMTVLLLPTVGGGLIDGATLVQKSTLTAAANSNARVRLVSGVAGGTVAASVAGTTVEAGAVSPTIGSYVTVPAGSASWAVTHNGLATALAPSALVAGSDNTLLVTGSSGATTATWLTDDNHAPATSGTDNMRLVNGLAGGASPLSLTVDFALLASNVAPGTASSYRSVAANSSLRLQVDSPLSASPLSLQTGLNIASGGVFSVFVLGDPASPVTVLRRDR